MQADSKKVNEFQTLRERTEYENSEFLEDLQVFELDNLEASYSLTRANDIQRMIRILSRNKRSVQMIRTLLQTIFIINDAEELVSNPIKQLDCILFKFKLLQDLATTLKMSTLDLLQYASDDICGKITYMLMLNGETIAMIDYYISTEFFVGHVLPRSWFFLLSNQKLTHEKLQETLLKIKWKERHLISLQYIKDNLHECIVQVAYTPKLNYSQKKNLLIMAKSCFGFQNDQELINLYNSQQSKYGYFESKLLTSLIKKLSFGKKYYLEKLMTAREKDKTLPYYIRKFFIQTEFYNKKGQITAKKNQNFIDALDFINKEIKKNQNLQQSDFAVAFLNTFSYIFPDALKKDVDSMKRQNKLIQFMMNIELLIKNNIVEDEYFKAAIVNMCIYVLRIGIESEETVEISIFSMQILLNAIGLKESMPYLNKFCSIAVQAHLKFPDKMKIKKYTGKIINFYIKDKARFTQYYFKDLQFLFLRKIRDIPALQDSINLVCYELYKSPDDIAESLKSLVYSLQTGNEDIRLLNTTYILELLEQQEQDEIRKVLVSQEILKIVYQGILELPQDYKQEKSRKLSIVCAKCIAAIGLCQSFVNDPLTLKATNQITLVGKKKQKEMGNQQDEFNPSIIKSDYYNPLTNLKYKNQEQDNTLELLAIPSFNDLFIERKDVVKFASDLLKKIISMTNLTDSKPQNFYYSQFLIDLFINQQKLIADNNQDEQLKEKIWKQQHIAHSINRYAPKDLSQVQVFLDPKNQGKASAHKYIKRLCLYLITKIEDKSWRELFESCIPVIRNSNEILEMILPYVMYYALRFNASDQGLPEEIGKIINMILESEFSSQIVPILKTMDFIKICCQQDKRAFKTFIENDTKFKYVERLFYIDYDISKVKDQNVLNFIKVIDQNPVIRHSFLVVKKIRSMIQIIDKLQKIKGAKHVKAYQRCVYNFEESYRISAQNQKDNQKGFLDVLTSEETIEIVNLHKQLNPEDFDYGIFNSIMNSYRSQLQQMKEQMDQEMFEENKNNQNMVQAEYAKRQQVIKDLYTSYTKGQIGEYWKNGQWEQVQEWAKNIDLMQLDANNIFLDRELDNPIQKFEFLIALFVAEYSKGIKHFLTNDENVQNANYLKSLAKVKHFFELLYHEFILSLDQQQGEISYYYKLFLHVIYEIESSVYFIKDALFHEQERITEILKKEVNRDKRKFEKIYLEFDMNNYFEKLLSWLEERSQMISNSTESLKLIYFVRRMLFKLFDRENEYAYYLMRLANIYRKTSNDVLEVNRLFKECEEYAHKIIDYELEYAKYTLKTKNAHEAFQYLMSKQDFIKEKCDNMYKATRFHWMPKKVYEKAVLLSIELQIKIDPFNPNILKRFDDFLKQCNNKNNWEKPVFRFAQYLDELENKAPSIQHQQQIIDQADIKKRAIQKIYYYITSLKYGHKYIWQSFPRALELWFEFNEKEGDVERINGFMKQELYKLEVFKLASVLQILLSRYAHSKENVREIIILVLSKIAIQYPGQCAWWIFHFLHFDQENAPAAMKKQQQIQNKGSITRHDFARQLLAKIMGQNEQAYKKIMECEKIFIELKKLSEKTPPQPNSSTMELPQSLQKISQTNLVMPIEENLSPQLPSMNFKMNYIQTCLVNTTLTIERPYQKNALFTNQLEAMEPSNENLGADENLNNLQDFPAFKPKPVLIAGFLNEATIMISKEKPKKIGIIGTNKQVYNFLLKCDKYGDLRKEQRFIDFAVLCNKMLENDSESRKRNLRLRTYAIVPLSRSTGLIEWIQNTSTLKTIVGDQWKKNNIKGEMQDIKSKAQSLKLGDTHEQIWDKIKEEIRPVLGQWMSDHFPSPEIWYEARINFIRSTAIWSMIGYVIGLGDRHGDNILIHQHTGEVTHVDFDCIFEKGAKLKIPEIVPFRLTQNIMDAFGLFKEKGVFQRTCEVVQRVLRKNSKNIISFLDSFIHDPLIESTQNIKVEIKHALEIVKQKLYGQIKGENGGSVTVEEQVEQVILHAINDDSLRKMYIGWMPWL